MMPTIISAGTPYSFSARSRVAWLSCQNFTPAPMRTGSMKRLRYTRQFLGVPAGAGCISRATPGRSWARPIGCAHPIAVQAAFLRDFVGPVHGLFIAGVGHASLAVALRSGWPSCAFCAAAGSERRRRRGTRTEMSRSLGISNNRGQASCLNSRCRAFRLTAGLRA